MLINSVVLVFLLCLRGEQHEDVETNSKLISLETCKEGRKSVNQWVSKKRQKNR